MNERRDAYIRVAVAMTKAGKGDLDLTSDKSAYFLRGIIDYAENGKKANLNATLAPETYRYSANAAILKHDREAYRNRNDKSLKDRKLHAEHVIPNIVVFRRLLELVGEGRSDKELADFLRSNCVVVVITKEERDLLDGAGSGLRSEMPDGWSWGDSRYSRLDSVGIKMENTNFSE